MKARCQFHVLGINGGLWDKVCRVGRNLGKGMSGSSCFL